MSQKNREGVDFLIIEGVFITSPFKDEVSIWRGDSLGAFCVEK